MWKPAERIRHRTFPGNWPTEAEAKESRLFSPLKSGRLVLNDRTWIPAMVPWRATENGEVSEDVIDWYARFAVGKPGAIVVEATGIRDVPSGPLLRIGDDRFVPGLRRLAEAVRAASEGHTRLFIQLIDFLRIRRRPKREDFLCRYLQISEALKSKLGMTTASEDSVRQYLLTLSEEELCEVLPARDFEEMTRGARERVTDIHLPHIASLPRSLPRLFAAAAARADAAGFDGVELHYAHAYTMASFLSRLNSRQDGYGGDPEGRVRLPLEVLAAVRESVSGDFVVGCRMLAEDCIQGGLRLEDSLHYAERLSNAGLDFLSLSRGGKFEDALPPKVGEAIYPYTGRSGYECMPQIISDEAGPFGRNNQSAQEIRQRLRSIGLDTPIIVAGGIHNFSQAEDLIRNGVADIAGLARQALADPDWFEKVRSGRGGEVRLCKYTNYCEGLDQKHKMVTCQLWDREHLNGPQVKRTPDGKRRTTAPLWRAPSS